MSKADFALALAILALLVSAIGGLPSMAILYGAWQEVRRKRQNRNAARRP